MLGLLSVSGGLFAQNLSNKGREFWVGYGLHQFMEANSPLEPGGNMDMLIYISTEQAATVTITIDSSGNAFSPVWTRTYNVAANSVISTETAIPVSGAPLPLTPGPIPKAGVYDSRLFSGNPSFGGNGGEGLFTKKGIHITSNVPIVAYAHIYGNTSSGATMLMPVETWGYSYVALNSKQRYPSSTDQCFSWVYVIAQHDSTLVEITPSVQTRLLKPANVPITALLMKGHIYQVPGRLLNGSPGDGLEMSGTKVRSLANAQGVCYPIAVFAGSSRTSNPAACGSGGGDNDNQQCFPSQAWGKRYLTAPTSNSVTASTPMVNTYKIAVKDPTTIVKRNGIQLPLASLINNSYYTFETNTADYILSDKPVMVAQYMTGGSACQGGGGVGDPEMMYISPIEQGIKRIGFYRTNLEVITVNYLTLIIPTGGLSSLTIDGTSAFSYTYPHPNLPGYTVVVRRWSAAKAQVIAQSDSAFTAITYGLGSVESYGYNAGTSINNLSAVGSIFNVNNTSGGSTNTFTCTNTPVKLRVLLGYETPPSRLVWQLSQVAGGLTPNADVTDNSPTPTGTVIVNGVSYFQFELPGTYTFSSVGTFRIPLLATHPSIDNCTMTEQLYYDVEVRGKPVADFAINATGCYLDTVSFVGQNISSNGFNINQWRYTFHDTQTSIQKDTVKRYAAPGTFNVNLRIISTEGCVSDTTKTVALTAAPIVGFAASAPSPCVGNLVTFTDTSSYTGSGSLSNSWWDFGDGTVISFNNTAPITHLYSTAGIYTVRHTAGAGASCVGDTVSRTVTIYALPTTTFSYPAGCLPASGTVQFTSTASTPDGQVITGHSWNFGDPGSGAANTSTLANPTHNYPTFGNYTITYSVTTANGCTKDTTVNATFNLAPTFSYPVLAPICQESAAVSVATATVTNSVPGTGIYSGPGANAAGTFNPVIAGPGIHIIKYIYTTTAGCTDSTSQTITVNLTPSANFAVVGSGCLPASGNVNFNYTGTIIAGQTYAWNFGDPASGAANTSTLQNPSHNYSTGPYTISLRVTTPSGCIKDSVLNTNFSVTPALAYPPLAAVCESVVGTISVATATVTNGVTGTGAYSGTGVDAAGNFNPSVAGPGNHIITYTFTSGGSCIAIITSTITVNAKPIAAFTYPTVACLPTTGIAQFTYTGSMSAGQTYAWDFGDPASGANNTSALANPTHTYTNTGSYTVSVTVTNSNGCVDTETITTTFSVTPALTYPALAAVCESVTGTISVATATVTNGVSGTGVYSGTAVDAAGNFNPSAAGPGTYVITYTFTSTGNCVASTTSTIVVNAKPAANFTFPTACLPSTGIAQFTYTGSMSAGQTYAWDFGDPTSGANNTSALVNPTHTYANAGNYTISVLVTNSNGCTDTRTVTTAFNITAALNYPALAPVCESVPGTVNVATATVTNGVTGTGVYSGPGTNAAGNFNPSIAGPGTHIITYTFTTTAGSCVSSITSSITVAAKPTADFTYPTIACLPTTGLAQFTYTGSASAGQTYLWNFGDPASGANNSSSIANPTHTYSNTGTYTVSVTVTNSSGCTDTKSVTTTFSVTPSLAYPALAAVCENIAAFSIANATVTNNVTGTGVYSGPGTNAAGNFNPATAGPGNHTITYTFTSTGNCTATITSTIRVNAKPTANFTYPTAACLPTTGVAQFTYTGSASAGQTYLWDFGDPASGANNSSTIVNPTHTYSNTGSYTISVTVTNTNGCVDTKTVTTTFSVTPALAYPALAAVCENIAAFSIANATVTNNVTGTGVYSGPGTDAAGNFNAAAAGPGTHTITYTFTSTGNCTATITSSITVNAKPVITVAAAPSAICENETVDISSTSTVPGGTTSSWNWNFGDGTTATYTNGNTFSHTYSSFGLKTITLTTTSNNGCVSNVASTNVTVYSTPVSSFTLPASVCFPAGAAQFTNTSTNADGTALTYLWNFGDGTTSTSQNPSHVYTSSAPVTVTLTVTNSIGCNNTSSEVFNSFYDKPNAGFTVNPTILCQGTPVQFTDQSNAPNSTVASRLWIFGDGSTSTQTNPTKTYAQPGVYTVKLVVTSAEGCVSDTSSNTVTVYLQPVIDAGPSFIVPQGTTITFSATANSNTVPSFLWTPSAGLSNPTTLNPSVVANFDQIYTLTATVQGTCTATDFITVRIIRPLKIPNAFSPNGDGINDTWEIENLTDYVGSTINVFSRDGQLVFTSVGYSRPWDGTFKGKPLPLATYYYVIELRNGFKPLSGPITILR